MEDRKDRQTIQQVFATTLSGLREDPHLAQRVLNIAHVTNKKRVGRKPSTLVAVTLILVLLFAATAFAITRPAVLKWLTGNAPTSMQLQSTAQSVTAENTADGITVRITGIVYDGQKLAFAYEVENDHPAMPVLIAANPTMRIDGKAATMGYCTADPSAPQMVPSPHLDVLPVQRNPAVGGGMVYIGDASKKTVLCEMTFVVYQPEHQFAIVLDPDSMQANVESYTGDARAEAEDSLHTLSSFRNAVFATDADRAGEQGDTVIDGSGMLYDLPENSHLTEISQITVTFAFDASLTFACDFAGTADQPLADATLHVDSFRLSSLETRIDLWLIPQQNTQKAANDLAETYGIYTLTDEQGEAVHYSEMDHIADNQPCVMQIDGQWVCRYQSEMPGLLHFPESVGFIAGGTELIRFDLMIEE